MPTKIRKNHCNPVAVSIFPLFVHYASIHNFKKGNQQDVHVNVRVNLTSRQKEILSLLRENPSLTLAELASQLNVNEKTIRRDLTLLRQQGLVLREGSDKKGLWRVVTE